jgi:hypothetical protein
MQPSLYLCDARTTQGSFSTTLPQLSMANVSTTAVVLALCGALVRLCVPSSSIVACRRESGYGRLSGEAHASTGPRQARVPSIVSSLQWLRLSISTEMKRKSVYAASRNTSHAFIPHLPYLALCFPKPDLLTSTMALFICPAPERKLYSLACSRLQ